MSETLDIISSVVAEREPTFGDHVTNLTTGKRFIAEIEAVQDIESNMLLGRDARESVVFHVASRVAAQQVSQGDVLQALGNRFSVLRRTDNPASPQVDFGAMLLTEYDK